jgi:SNF2 family DNA or RNA helicase
MLFYKLGYELVKAAAKFELQPHQQRVVEKMRHVDQLLAYHGLGSGKTITGLAVGEDSRLPMDVVGPASLRGNFGKEVERSGYTPASLKVYSYQKPPVGKEQGGLLVFDEAHRMGREDTQVSKLPDQLQRQKTLLLTGTPIRNNPAELIPLLRALDVKVPYDTRAFLDKYTETKRVGGGWWDRLFNGATPGTQTNARNLDDLERKLKGKVDYHVSDGEGYPKVTEEQRVVEMTPHQQQVYDAVLKGNPGVAYKIRHNLPPSKQELKSLNSFLSGARQVSNHPQAFDTASTIADSPKILKAVADIKEMLQKDPRYRGVSYSTYLAAGVDPLARLLTQEGIPFARYTGEEGQKTRTQTVRDYNDGKIKQLLLSGAGGEGLDLKGTKLIQLLEPHWNDPALEQVKGRAVRYKSHAHLPTAEQKVIIRNYLARPREHGWFFKSRDTGTDEYLTELAARKSNLSEQFLQMLQRAGT